MDVLAVYDVNGHEQLYTYTVHGYILAIFPHNINELHFSHFTDNRTSFAFMNVYIVPLSLEFVNITLNSGCQGRFTI